jgi:hypothetical protein
LVVGAAEMLLLKNPLTNISQQQYAWAQLAAQVQLIIYLSTTTVNITVLLRWAQI